MTERRHPIVSAGKPKICPGKFRHSLRKQWLRRVKCTSLEL